MTGLHLLDAMCIWYKVGRTARSTEIEIISSDGCGQLHKPLAKHTWTLYESSGVTQVIW